MSYIQLFDISGNTIYSIDPDNTLQVGGLIVSGSTFSTETLVTSGTTQEISGLKNFTGGINVTGLTAKNLAINGNLNFINTDTGKTNQNGQYLIYDQNVSGYTNKYNNYVVKYVNFAMSPYLVPDVSYHLIVDTSGGNVTINLPNYSSVLLGGSIVVAKITTDPNTIHIHCPTGYTFLDGEIDENINKFNEHIQYTMVGPYGNYGIWGKKYADYVDGIMDFVEDYGTFEGKGLSTYTLNPGSTLQDFIEELKTLLIL